MLAADGWAELPSTCQIEVPKDLEIQDGAYYFAPEFIGCDVLRGAVSPAVQGPNTCFAEFGMSWSGTGFPAIEDNLTAFCIED